MVGGDCYLQSTREEDSVVWAPDPKITAGTLAQQRLDTPCVGYAKEVGKKPLNSKLHGLADCKLRRTNMGTE